MRALPVLSLLAFACSSAPSLPGEDASAAKDMATTTEAAAADSWNSWGRSFFATYCVECHGAGNAKRDYTTYADVGRDQSMIACGVAPTALAGCGASPAPRQFPISNANGTNPKPTDDERARLVAWIQAGAPQ